MFNTLLPSLKDTIILWVLAMFINLCHCLLSYDITLYLTVMHTSLNWKIFIINTHRRTTVLQSL